MPGLDLGRILESLGRCSGFKATKRRSLTSNTPTVLEMRGTGEDGGFQVSGQVRLRFGGSGLASTLNYQTLLFCRFLL